MAPLRLRWAEARGPPSGSGPRARGLPSGSGRGARGLPAALARSLVHAQSNLRPRRPSTAAVPRMAAGYQGTCVLDRAAWDPAPTALAALETAACRPSAAGAGLGWANQTVPQKMGAIRLGPGPDRCGPSSLCAGPPAGRLGPAGAENPVPSPGPHFRSGPGAPRRS